MAFNPQAFAARLKNGGTSPSLFEVKLFNPIVGDSDAQTPFFVRAATLPASIITPIEVPYFGRKLKIPGERVFEPWVVTIINSEDFKVRDRLERWSAAINSHKGNLRARENLTTLMSDALVTQYSQTGVNLRTVKFSNMWPTNIGPIELDWENSSAIEVFQVEFVYQDWTNSSGSTVTDTLA